MRVVLRGRASGHLYRRVTVLRALVALLRGGSTLTEALEGWAESLPETDPAIERVSRKVRLGADPSAALSAATPVLGEDLDALRAAIELHDVAGADPVPMIDRAASVIGRRADEAAAGKAATSGAKLSGWMVGGLPLVSLPLLPLAGAPILDRPGVSLMFVGLALTVGGMAWMARLVPAARTSDDPPALFADHLAAAIGAGASVPLALELCCGCAPLEIRTELSRALRRVKLGDAWADALRRSEDACLRELAVVVDRSESLGVSPVDSLEAFASKRRAAVAHAFERKLRRAPVLMVLPLVLCVLPAFGLLAVVPFLRGITFA
jgi:tight adherence protein B